MYIGGVDAKGNVVAWHHRISAPSIETFFDPKAAKPGDSETGGIEDLPYDVPNFRLDFALANSGVPRGWWRSVEHSINGFVVSSFVDELAAAAGADLDQLPAAHEHVAPFGERVDGQQHRRGAVVDHQHGLGVQQLGEPRLGVALPGPALAA